MKSRIHVATIAGQDYLRTEHLLDQEIQYVTYERPPTKHSKFGAKALQAALMASCTFVCTVLRTTFA